MKKNNLFLLIFLFAGLLFFVIIRSELYICNNETIFYTNTDTVVSKKYYRNIEGDWVLVDKNIKLKNQDIKSMEISLKTINTDKPTETNGQK